MSTPIISQPTEQQALFSLLLQYITEPVLRSFHHDDKVTEVASQRGIEFGISYSTIRALCGLPTVLTVDAIPSEHLPACLSDSTVSWTASRKRFFLAALNSTLWIANSYQHLPVVNISFLLSFLTWGQGRNLSPELVGELASRVRSIIDLMHDEPQPTVQYLTSSLSCAIGLHTSTQTVSSDEVIHLCHLVLKALGVEVVHDDQYQVSVDDLELVGFDAEDEQPQPAALSTQRESDALDAARYRWLRSRDIDTIQHGGVFAGLTPSNIVLNGEDLDKAIDDAMRAGGVA